MEGCPLCRVYIHDYIEASLVQGFRKTYRSAYTIVPQFAHELWTDLSTIFQDDWLADCVAYRCRQIEKKSGRGAAEEYCITKQRRLRDAFEHWGVILYETGVANESVLVVWLSNLFYDLFLGLPGVHTQHARVGPDALSLAAIEWDEVLEEVCPK
jgi:hypothetical protein